MSAMDHLKAFFVLLALQDNDGASKFLPSLLSSASWTNYHLSKSSLSSLPSPTQDPVDIAVLKALSPILGGLVAAESSYHTLSFVRSTLFFNTKLVDRYQALETTCSQQFSKLGLELQASPSFARWQSLKLALEGLLAIRREMLRSYARLGEFASNPADFGAIVSIIEPLKQMIVDLDFDEYLGELSETLKLELDILQSLCRAQDALYDMDFKSSTLDMYAARTSLARWMDKLGLQASSNSKEHRVLMWLSVFASATRWKFDCYFYRLLKSSDSLTSKSATSIEDKHVEALSFRSILSSQCLNLPLSNLSFIYVIPAGGSYFKDGYTCRGRDSYEQLRGIQSFPAILSYPEDTPPMSHWPNIIGVFQDHFELRYLEGQSRPILVQRTVQQRPMLGSNFAKLASRSQLASSGLVQFYDEAVDVTYCMHKMDRFLAAVIIYQGRVSNTDVMARTLALFTLLAEKLQLTDVLRVLK